MLVAKVQNGIVLEVADCRELCEWYPPTAEQLADRNLVKVNTYREYDSLTQKLVPCTPVLEGEWVYTVAVEALTEEEVQAAKDAAIDFLRVQRNSKLASCDWTQLADSPVDKQVWATYRQALRDFPATVADARLPIEWPEQP